MTRTALKMSEMSWGVSLLIAWPLAHGFLSHLRTSSASMFFCTVSCTHFFSIFLHPENFPVHFFLLDSHYKLMTVVDAIHADA